MYLAELVDKQQHSNSRVLYKANTVPAVTVTVPPDPVPQKLRVNWLLILPNCTMKTTGTGPADSMLTCAEMGVMSDGEQMCSGVNGVMTQSGDGGDVEIERSTHFPISVPTSQMICSLIFLTWPLFSVNVMMRLPFGIALLSC